MSQFDRKMDGKLLVNVNCLSNYQLNDFKANNDCIFYNKKITSRTKYESKRKIIGGNNGYIRQCNLIISYAK